MTDTASARWQTGSDPAALIDGYREGDFVFATDRHTLFARGVGDEIFADGVTELSEQLRAAFADSPNPIAVGVLPFAPVAPRAPLARLVIPAHFHAAPTAVGLNGQRRVRAVGTPVSVHPVPGEEQHVEAVAHAREILRSGSVQKVVLARALDMAFDAEIDPARIVRNLVADNPDGYTFAAALPGPDQRTLVGSSPELLVRRVGRTVVAHPHAGTAARSVDPVVDRRNAEQLLASAKDKAEHDLVVEAVVAALRPLCRSIEVPPEPSLTSTSAVWHLGTEITGTLRSTEVDALQLAGTMHPTPAVCGTPTAAARALVSELEPFERDYYAGAVGWVDAAGDGEWVVAIRCAEIAGKDMRLYAGGGIVAASDPRAELAETTAKFQTLLRAMGVAAE